MSSSRAPTLAEAIAAALADDDNATAARLLRRAFGRESDDSPGTEDLPELLEALAEYYLTQDNPEDAIVAAARAICLTEARALEPDGLRCRCRIAEILLRAGLPDEAYAVYASVAEDAPGQTWVHEAAGSDYVDAGEYELALGWLTAGLEIALVSGERSCVARLAGLRRICNGVLGLPPDVLDLHAEKVLARRDGEAIEDVLLDDEIDLTGDTPQRVIRLVGVLRAAGRL